MRKILFILLSAFCIQAMAQKIDATLLEIVQKNAKTVNTSKVKKANGHKEKPESMTVINKTTGETRVLDFKHVVNGVDTMRLKQMYELSFNGDGTIRTCTVIGTLNEGASVPTERLKKLGVTVDNVVRRYVIMTVPAESLEKLGTLSEFSVIKGSRINQVNNYNSRMATSVNFVTGESTTEYGGITEKYDGTGVVVGVIDTGIDFNHAAFLDPETGRTRIKMAGYFQSNNIKKITEPTEIKGLTTCDTNNSHGSHTSCTAAGSSVGDLGLQGMAPKADLALFDLGNSLSDGRILSATEAIFDYADSVNKPAVVNMSFGNVFDYHDGSGLPEEIAKLTGEGRIVCVSAGNDADLKMSVRKTLGAADMEGYNLRFVIASNTINDDGKVVYSDGLETAIYANDSAPFTVDLKAIDLSTGETFDISPILKTAEGTACFDSADKASFERIIDNGKSFLLLQRDLVQFDSDNKNLAIAVCVKGQEGQTISAIDNNVIRHGYDIVGEESYPSLIGYADGDDQLSINALACCDSIISVGSYIQSRSFHNAIDGKNYGVPDTYTNEIAFYSGYGIDDNGKSRPDIVSPGMWTVSAYNIYDKSYFTEMKQPADPDPDITNIVNIEGSERPYPYGAMTGTSMSCPAATGIVALWLQANPNLSPSNIRNILKETALNDKWTTITDNVPSGHLTQAGFGKINALRGIKAIENAKEEMLYPLNETITIANGITTFSSMQPLDFSASSAPKAYVATDYTDGVLNFLRVEQCIPSQTGLLLVGAEGTYTVPIVPTTKEGGSNLLKSTASASVALSQEGEAYVLSKQNGVVGFYQNAAGLVVPQGKAYLTLPSDTPQQAKAIGYVFSEDGSTTTGEEYEEIGFKGLWHPVVVSDAIDNITIAPAPSPFHNLQGQRVGNDYRGIIIINGKKYIQR